MEKVLKDLLEDKEEPSLDGEIVFVDASTKISSTTNFIEASHIDIKKIILENVIGKLDE